MKARGELSTPADRSRPWAPTVLDLTSHRVALLDRTGTLLECSQALLDLLGRRREDFIGRPLSQLPYWYDDPGAQDRLLDAVARALAGEPVRYEVESRQEPFTAFEVELTPVQGADGPLVVADVRDLTQARSAVRAEAHRAGEAEEARRVAAERAAQFQLALEATGLAMWTWDLAADKLTWSPPPTWSTVPAPEHDNPMQLVAQGAHPEDRDRVRDAVAAALAGKGVLDVEFRVTGADGQTRWLLARGDVVHDVDGLPVRVAGILLDVTERALSRIEHARLLQAERRASRRAGALQRVAVALSEAATSEQVAAVMVEESLRSLGVDAARIELERPEDVTGGPQLPPEGVVRIAGAAHLLTAPEGCGVTALRLSLDSRGRHRGEWVLAWKDGGPGPGAGAGADLAPPLWAPSDWTAPEGLDLLHALSTECSQAIDRAELYEQQRDIATVLQRTLLPSVLPEVEGAQVAARYQPGGRGVDVGGDWYDVISLPEGRTGLVIGDVEGHSAAAAGVMGQVRNALRAYAVEGSPPSIVMQRVNRLLVRLGVSQLVSCCYLEFAPTEGTATVVLAGHPPPLLVVPQGQCDFVPALPNLVLGVDESARYLETTVLLDPGACLLLFTDGLVESVSRSLPEGLAELRSWAADWDVDDSPDELVERLIRRARDGLPVIDDVAVLALRYRPTGRALVHRARTVRRIFPLDPTSAFAARRFVTDVLDQWDLDDVVNQVTLMTSELVTNSVLHTSGELELALRADDERLRVEVVDHSERLPALQHPDDEAPGGRGLLIIEALADRWGVYARASGKAVWFEVLLNTPAPVG